MSGSGPSSGLKLRALKRVGQLTGHVAFEKMARPKARRLDQVPTGPSAVTTEWLTAVLCRDHPGAEVRSVQVRDISRGTSTRWGMGIDYNDAGLQAGLPVDVFAKTTTAFSQRLILGMADVIGGEIGFYRDIRPYLDIDTPHAYFTEIDDRSWRSIVLIENIAVTKKASFSSPRTPVSKEQMEHLLGDMAVYHGRYWNNRALDLHTRWLKTPAKHLENISQFIGMRERSEIGLGRAGDVVPAALQHRYDDLWHGLEKALELASRGDRTFLHGDAHVGNTFTTEQGRMGLTDWQVCVKGLWAYDLAYIMSTGLVIDDRRAWERDLIAFYLDGLAANGGPALGFDEAFLAYRQQLFYPLFAWLLTIGRSAIQPKMQSDETSRALIERTTTAILDLDSFAAVGIR